MACSDNPEDQDKILPIHIKGVEPGNYRFHFLKQELLWDPVALKYIKYFYQYSFPFFADNDCTYTIPVSEINWAIHGGYLRIIVIVTKDPDNVIDNPEYTITATIE